MIVGGRVNHNGAAIRIEKRGRSGREAYPVRSEAHFRLAVRGHREIRSIAGVRARGIHQPMLPADGIVVRTGAGEGSGSIALTDGVKMNSMFAGRQIVELQLDMNDQVGILPQLGSSTRVSGSRGDCRICDGDPVQRAGRVGAARKNGGPSNYEAA